MGNNFTWQIKIRLREFMYFSHGPSVIPLILGPGMMFQTILF